MRTLGGEGELGIGEVDDGLLVWVEGNKRVLISFRRKGMLFVGVVGESADWIICEVVV